MENIEKTTIEPGVTRLTISLKKEDYLPEFERQLRKFRNTVTLKGFRKGAAPLGLIKKMAGQRLFGDTISKKLQELIDKGFEGLEILGSPVPDPEVPNPEISMQEPRDYNFSFIGISIPEIDLKLPQKTFTHYIVKMTDEEAEKELEKLQNRVPVVEEITEGFDDQTELTIAREDVEEASPMVIKKDSFDKAKYWKAITKLKVGDSFTLNPQEEITENLRSSVMDSLKCDAECKVKIVSAVKKTPAKLDQEFFDKAFGPGEVSSKEEALDKIKEINQEQFERHANHLLYTEWSRAVTQENKIDIPTKYLEILLQYQFEGKLPEEIAKTLPRYEEDYKTATLRKNLAAHYGVPRPSKHDVLHYMAHQFAAQFGIDAHHPMLMDYVRKTAKENIEEYIRYSNELWEDQIFNKAKEDLKTNEKEVGVEEFLMNMDRVIQQSGTGESSGASGEKSTSEKEKNEA